MDQGRIIVITGSPGTGKTTTASTVAKESDLEKSVQENFITNIKKFIVHLLEAVPNDIEKLNFSDYQEQKEKEAEKTKKGKREKISHERSKYISSNAGL